MTKTWLTLASILICLFGGSVAAARQADPVRVRAIPQFIKAHAGDQFAVAVVIEFDEHWHIWPPASKGKVPPGIEGLQPMWTYLGPARTEEDNYKQTPAAPEFRGDGFRAYAGAIQWPEPVNVTSAGFTGSPLTVLSYAAKTVVFVPVVIDPDARLGVQTLNWSLFNQACDEGQCMQPGDTPVSVSWEIVPNDVPVVPNDQAATFKNFEASVFGTLANLAALPPPTIPSASQTASFDFFGYSFTLDTNQYILIFLIAFVAGFLLNLTPCVLPVIPIKVMSLQKQAGNPQKLLLYGTVYCIGILAMFGVLGLLIAFARQQWGQMFSSPWFVVSMGLIVLVMGIGMMGFFTIRLPQSVYMINPAGDTVQGNFALGVLTAILSTPCTGPFLGAVLAWAATRPSWVGLTTLLVMGAGMAFPYALLIIFPKLIDRMPRSGPGGEMLKQVMGGLMVAVAVFLFSNLTHAKWPWWIIGGIGAASFAWALLRVKLLRTTRSRALVGVLALLGVASSLGLGYIMTRASDIPWKTIYTAPSGGGIVQKAIDDARTSGKFVVVKFTANWCGNCHVIEKAVFNTSTGIRELNRPDVVPIKVDLSRGNDEGYEVLRSLSGGTGIPFSIFFRPGEEPITFRSFFKVSDLRQALERKSTTAGTGTGRKPGA
jgi:thiol:disulfide interchange protein